MEISFKKWVLKMESKGVEIKGNLTLFLELYLNLWIPSNVVASFTLFELFLIDFSAWIICGELLEV